MTNKSDNATGMDKDLVMSEPMSVDEFYRMMENEGDDENEPQIETKTRRLAAGEYEVHAKSDPTRVVSISLLDFWDGPGWVASANWDQNRYTDPLSTKREAVVAARHMLSNKE